MLRAGVTLVIAGSILAAFAFVVLGHPVAPGARHWAAAPLLAVSIVGSMGGLVALATSRRGSLK